MPSKPNRPSRARSKLSYRKVDALLASGQPLDEQGYAALSGAEQVEIQRRLFDRSGELADDDPAAMRLMLSPEQLARIEEVQAGWTPRKNRKRKNGPATQIRQTGNHWQPPTVEMPQFDGGGKWNDAGE